MFELRQMEQLDAIGECGTLSGASDKLYLSQPALSRSMQKLEKDMGVPLFTRQKNKIELNETGKLAASYARMLLTQASDIEEKLLAFYRAQNTISVGSCAPAPIWQLVPYLSEYFPGMSGPYLIFLKACTYRFRQTIRWRPAQKSV